MSRRNITWDDVQHTVLKFALPYLSPRATLSLDSALMNHEARHRLVEAYKALTSPGFNQYVYPDEEDYRALRWVMKKGINLRGFRLAIEDIEGGSGGGLGNYPLEGTLPVH